MKNGGRDRFSGRAAVEAARHLRSPERLVWAGYSDAGAALGPVIQSTLFGLFFVGFAAIWTFLSWAILSEMDGGLGLFPFVGGVFVLVGLVIVFQGIRKFIATRSQLYVLSSERLLVVSGRRRQHVWSTDLYVVTGLDMTVKPNGDGELVLLLEGGDKKTLKGVIGVEGLADEVDRLRRAVREGR